MATKSQRRKLAEQIAAEKGIKVSSAMRYLQRVAAPEGKQRIVNPKYSGVSEKLRKKVKRTIAKTKRRIVEKIPVVDVDVPLYEYAGTRLLKMYGRVESGSSGSGDIRDRWVNYPVSAAQASDILSADNESDAAERFAEIVPFIAGVESVMKFRFDGEDVRF